MNEYHEQRKPFRTISIDHPDFSALCKILRNPECRKGIEDPHSEGIGARVTGYGNEIPESVKNLIKKGSKLVSINNVNVSELFYHELLQKIKNTKFPVTLGFTYEPHVSDPYRNRHYVQ